MGTRRARVSCCAVGQQMQEPGTPAEAIGWEALARYLARESDAREMASVRRWLAARPARARWLAALERALGALTLRAPAELDVERALRRVLARRCGTARPGPVRPPASVIPLRPPAPGVTPR